MLRAMTVQAALYLLANSQQNASEELKREYREHFKRRAADRHSSPGANRVRG
jgi:hypothetical protein